MKTTIIALFAAVLITAAPAVHARNVLTKTAEQQHKVFTKRHQVVSGYASWRVTQANPLVVDTQYRLGTQSFHLRQRLGLSFGL